MGKRGRGTRALSLGSGADGVVGGGAGAPDGGSSKKRGVVAADAPATLDSVGGMIRHTVVFRLRHEPSSPEEGAFLADAERHLAGIPGVQRFERLREVSPKNSFAFGLSMQFADAAAYEAYNRHPAHESFVRDRWVPEVADFLEIDYVDYEPPAS